MASVALVSVISLVGSLALVFKKEVLEKITIILVAFSAGALFGDAFFHLLPEMAANGGDIHAWLSVVLGILIFFVLEKIICWRHCHVPTTDEHPHPFGVMNLIGDGLHNLIDGMIIAGAFLVSPALGLATTLAIVAHEIPQEISDFGVLIHAGFTKKQAVFYNLLSATAAFVGAGAVLLAGGTGLNGYIIPFTAGGFIYIAGSDLIPELHKETAPKESAKQLVFIAAGAAVMWLLKIFLE